MQLLLSLLRCLYLNTWFSIFHPFNSPLVGECGAELPAELKPLQSCHREVHERILLITGDTFCGSKVTISQGKRYRRKPYTVQLAWVGIKNHYSSNIWKEEIGFSVRLKKVEDSCGKADTQKRKKNIKLISITSQSDSHSSTTAGKTFKWSYLDFFTCALGQFYPQCKNYNLSGCTKIYLQDPLDVLSSIFIWWADLKQQICT